MNELWHYTCCHRAPMIDVMGGVLIPHPQPVIGGIALVWLTDLPEPDRDGLGLTSNLITCDRTEFRYRALSHVGVRPWMTSQWRAQMDGEWRADLERYGSPLHWYVSDMPIPAEAA